ncbi:MAG: dihydroorotase [Bacteroidales bacterium]|nr:dihydroorotase [Bacteroidales bacterium]
MNIYIKNATIFNEGKQFKGSVLLKDGKIATVLDENEKIDLPKTVYTIDAAGKWLFPGVIDDQVHFRDPGFPEKADFFTETRAAVAGGVTSVMDMPNTKPQTVTQQALSDKFKMAAEKSLTNYSFYFGATNDNIDEILKIDPSKVCGLKVFMGSSTGNMLVDNPESLEKIFSKAPGLVAVHCEDEKTIQENTKIYRKKYGEDMPLKYHPEIRSEEACYLSSSLAVQLAKKHNTRLHILHLSTAKELSLFDDKTPLSEKKITGEVCVHHLWFDETDYDKFGTKIKWNPAIKTAADKRGLLQGVIDNKIDVIATDHAPHTIEEKNNPYFKAPSGGPLIQHSLLAMLELAYVGKIDIHKVVEKMCHAPADLFHIEKRGYIREGYWADLTLIDPEQDWTVGPENILYKCGWSPFEGQTFHRKVISTIVNGKLVYENGEINESVKGKPLTFK